MSEIKTVSKRDNAIALLERIEKSAAKSMVDGTTVYHYEIEAILSALKNSVPEPINAGCPECGETVEVSDVEIEGDETYVYVGNCSRCMNRVADHAFWRGQQVGK